MRHLCKSNNWLRTSSRLPLIAAGSNTSQYQFFTPESQNTKMSLRAILLNGLIALPVGLARPAPQSVASHFEALSMDVEN